MSTAYTGKLSSVKNPCDTNDNYDYNTNQCYNFNVEVDFEKQCPSGYTSVKYLPGCYKIGASPVCPTGTVYYQDQIRTGCAPDKWMDKK
jgi:hypothetical protein